MMLISASTYCSPFCRMEMRAAGGTSVPLMFDWLMWLSIPKVNAEWEKPAARQGRRGVSLEAGGGTATGRKGHRGLNHLIRCRAPRLLVWREVGGGKGETQAPEDPHLHRIENSFEGTPISVFYLFF